MDPFAERLVKRARARRDMLEAEASSVGVTITHKITPLLDMDQTYNVHKAVSPRKVNFSPKKTPATASPVRSSPAKLTREPSLHSPRKALTAVQESSDDEDVNITRHLRRDEHSSDAEHEENMFSDKENGEDSSDLGMRDGMRSRLKRLGALYSGSGELSSPIHRTENEFCVAPEESKPSAKNTARVARLAALATTINQWEDDLSHPSSVVPIESQGFTRTESRSRLIYDFEKDEQSSDLSPEKLTEILEERGSPLRHGTPPRFGTPPRHTTPPRNPTPTKRQSPAPASPQRRVNFASPAKESQPFRVALKNVGGVDSSPAEGSVLQRAAQYEAANSPTQKQVKDPADLPLHERMALFEKNKGPLLVPKVPFSTPMPAKLLQEKSKSSPQKPCPPIKDTLINRSAKASPQKAQTTNAAAAPKPNKLLAKLQMFESGEVQSEESPSRPQVQAILERQREVEMLANRWNRMKEASTSATTPPPPPPPPPSSTEPRSPVRVMSMTPKSPQVGTPPPPPPLPGSPLAKVGESPRKIEGFQRKSPLFKEPKEYPGVSGVKRIKTSPPRAGQLYPSLSDMEATTETESYTSANTSISDTESCSDTNSADCSFGRDLLAAAQKVSSARKTQAIKKGRFETSESDVSITESNVLDDIDDYLDEAMGGPDSDSEGPSPSKRSRDHSASTWSSTRSSPSQKVTSPRSPYTRPSPKRVSPLKTSSPEGRSSQDEEYEQRPLMHTVSFYRRQQNARGTPVKQIVRNPTPEKVFVGASSDATSSDGESHVELIDESALVRERIKELRCELERQRTLIDQNSKYLNICLNTVEFPNFDGRVESERLLLVATQSHRAIQNEVTRLEVEKTLCPKGQGGRNGTQLIERGKLHVEEITVPLKRDFILSLAADDDCHHFVCLVKCNEQVLATSLISVEPTKGIEQDQHLGSVIRFKKELLLSNLYSNFTVTVEVYTMRTMKEKAHSKHHSKKDLSKHRMTPKKSKQDSVFVKPPLQSPAGPMAVRSSQFKMIGYVVFSLKEIHRTQFTLNKVVDGGTLRCPLQGSIHLKLKSDLSLNIEEKGFLTMFEDVSGFGAWHRRWCVLKGEHLSYWKYPDDVSKKIAIGSIDLRTCITTEVGPVNREICARHNTFLLETTRPARPDDKDSLVTICKRNKTIIRHLLSADSKEERIKWCNSLNKALNVMSAWGQKSES